MNLEQCNIELSQYLHLKGKRLMHNSGTHFIIIGDLKCVKNQTKEFPNNHFIEVSFYVNGSDNETFKSIGFLISNYQM